MSQLLRPPRSFWNNTLVFTSEDAVLREVTWQIGKVQKIKAGLFEFVPTDPKKPKTVLSNNVTKRRFWAVMLERTLESPLDHRRSVLGVHWRDWCWSWNSNTLATWCGELTHLKRPWCWERLRTGGEGDDRGWDGWMASPTQWTWVWVNSRS